MTQITGGHLAAKYMRDVEKVRMVFTLSGGHIETILDGFTEYGITTIDVRHEQAAAMMAHAWTIYNNEPGVCLVTAGPGFTNALTGIGLHLASREVWEVAAPCLIPAVTLSRASL